MVPFCPVGGGGGDGGGGGNYFRVSELRCVARRQAADPGHLLEGRDCVFFPVAGWLDDLSVVEWERQQLFYALILCRINVTDVMFMVSPDRECIHWQ